MYSFFLFHIDVANYSFEVNSKNINTHKKWAAWQNHILSSALHMKKMFEDVRQLYEKRTKKYKNRRQKNGH